MCKPFVIKVSEPQVSHLQNGDVDSSDLIVLRIKELIDIKHVIVTLGAALIFIQKAGTGWALWSGISPASPSAPQVSQGTSSLLAI